MRRSIGIALAVSLVVVACGGAGDVGTDTTESPGTTTATGTSADASATTTRPLYGTVAPEGDGGAEAEITIEDFSFGTPIEVATGETITITNADGVPHTWTAEDGAFDSGTIGGGETFEHTFDEPGTFAFFCEIHPGMTGTITVTG